jgi:hypothetical protein
MFNLQYFLNLSGNSVIYLAQFKIFSISSWFPKLIHPPSSSVSLLPAKVTICQQKFVPVIIRRVHHLPFTSLKISRLRTYVHMSLDRHVGIIVATYVWWCMLRQMLARTNCHIYTLLPPDDGLLASPKNVKV